VGPRTTGDDMADCCFADTISICERFLVRLTRGALGADSMNLPSGQFGKSILLATRRNLATLSVPVAHIVKIGSEEKMSRIATNRIVATVTDKQVRRDGAVCDSPCDAGGEKALACNPNIPLIEVFPLGRKRMSAMRTINGAFKDHPIPAFIGASDVNPAPKTIQVLRTQWRDAKVFDSHARLLTRRSWSERLAA